MLTCIGFVAEKRIRPENIKDTLSGPVKIIELNVHVNHYTALLTKLGADSLNHVRFNGTLLANLISLLPPTYYSKWFDKRVTMDELENEWDVFCAWLIEMEKRANHEKLADLRRADKAPVKPPKVGVSSTDLEGLDPASVCPVCLVHHQRTGINTAIVIDCLEEYIQIDSSKETN